MRTPAGKECRFYYQDFHRGANEQECRLVAAATNSAAWRPEDCAQCPVPEILMANNDPNLVLEARIKKGVLRIGRKVEVNAFCSKHLVTVSNPHIGCPQCAAERPGVRDLFGE
ncbi:MAG: hypothetical protein M9941_06900 [Anaerolineae bacterium]|nr:hypothetical protein [Anaerolineae bacterium]MCO5188724.1 hypothetical protein [Anaerolineae bacterium]MCO5197462.1 hypothetical protein [Anaerolineae bacterium]